MSADLPPVDTPEWEVLDALLRGDRWFVRDETPEPSLLPHLARLCHGFSLGEMWTAAEVVGVQNGPLAWPQLLEMTTNRLALRFDDATFTEQLPWVPFAEVAVRRCLGGAPPSRAFWTLIDEVEDEQRRLGLAARYLQVDPDRGRLDRLLGDVDSTWILPETARAIITAASNLGRPLDDGWIEDSLEGHIGVGHTAHVMTALTDSGHRERLADRIVAEVNQGGWPDWWTALVVSRVAPHLSGSVSFDLAQLLDPTEIWRPLVATLATAERAISLDEDVLRAHPYRAEFDAIADPHEVTHGVGGAIIDRHGGAPEAAAPILPGADPPPSFPSPPPVSDGSNGGSSPPRMVDAPTAAPPSAAPASAAPASAAPASAAPASAAPASAAPAAPAAPVGSEVPRMVDDDPTSQPDNRRLGVDLFVGGTVAPAPIPAATDVTVLVSIGHGAAHSLSVTADIGFPSGVKIRSLPVRFVNATIDRTETMAVQVDPTTTASVSFVVGSGTEALTGTIIVYNEDQSAVIQAAALSAPVAGSDAAASDPTVRFVQVDALALSAGPRTGAASVVADEASMAAAAPSVSISASSGAVMNQFAAVVAGIQTAAGQFVHAAASIEATLLGVAQVGAQLRTQLGLDRLSGFDRIQMIAVDTQTVFPIDLIYDGEEPNTDATMCPNWKQALEQGSCTTCGQLDPADARQFVCPIRFWGLSKIIEHHRPGAGTSTFEAHVQIGPQPEHLTAPSSVLIGASELVLQRRRNELGDMSATAAVALADVARVAEEVAAVTVAADWDGWRDAIDGSPTVLLAMPHNGEVTQGFVTRAALELGGTMAPSITEDFVRAPGEAVGPIVMLLGCNTGVDQRVLLSFASSFRVFSPAVVATLGEVIVSEAPEIARAILAALSPPHPEGAPTVGEAVRQARRQLMSQSRLVALQLMMHGDGDWILEEG